MRMRIRAISDITGGAVNNNSENRVCERARTHRRLMCGSWPRHYFFTVPTSVTTAFGAVVVSLALCSTAAAVLHTGVVGFPLTGGGWDFSDSLEASPASGADIVYAVTVAHTRAESANANTLTDLLLAISPSAITYIGSADSTYENLTAAPTDPSLYGPSEAARPNDVLVVRTREGHYAKLRILMPAGGLFRFEYTYQDDGSASFVPSVSARSTTWGYIKSLYRSD